MRDEEEVKKIDYPYISADWLSLRPGEYEEGKKRTPFGWMSEEEMYMTKMYEWPIDKIGQALPPLPIGAMMDKPSPHTGARICVTRNFAIWERARKRLVTQGY